MLSPHTKGVEIEPTASLDNERVGRVTLHGVRVPRSTCLTPEPVGHGRLAEALALIRVLRAALIVGGAQQMLDMTVEHVQTRHQFGRALGTFQAVQHACADMRIDVDAALLATGEALSRADADLPFLREAAIATFVAGRSGERAARTAAQLHGGLGFTAEYHLQHYFRRAKAARLRLGRVPDQLRDAAALLIDPAAHGEPLADPARAR
jgi:alkylation response protein AidB-like acyl-CoA dehydrogenase